MQTLKARVTSKGQVTLPKLLRQSLGIREGDQVEIIESKPYSRHKRWAVVSVVDRPE